MAEDVFFNYLSEIKGLRNFIFDGNCGFRYCIIAVGRVRKLMWESHR